MTSFFGRETVGQNRLFRRLQAASAGALPLSSLSGAASASLTLPSASMVIVMITASVSTRRAFLLHAWTAWSFASTTWSTSVIDTGLSAANSLNGSSPCG